MTTQLRLVAVGHIDTMNPNNDKLVCDPSFQDTWHEGIVKSIDLYTAPVDLVQDAYFMGTTDRDLGLPSIAASYDDAELRAAYLAGRCAAKRILSAKEILDELEDLREAMDDEDFWRIGAW